MELLDQYTGKLGLKRKRNQGEASLTMMAKRPDLCVLVRNALLFKGEDKYEEGKLDQAVAELKQKMRRWSRSYHGQVSLLLCICHKLNASLVSCKDSVIDADHARSLPDGFVCHEGTSMPGICNAILPYSWNSCYAMQWRAATSGSACCVVMTQTAALFSVVITTSME